MLQRWTKLLKEHINEHGQQMVREPSGILKYPYIVPSIPSQPFYSDVLWDWDSWFSSVALGQLEADNSRQGEFLKYAQGSILNFLDHTDADGVMPIMLHPIDGPLAHGDPSRASGFSENMHKPVLAQQAAILARQQGGIEWLIPHLGKLELFLNRYLESHVNPETGLAFWQSDFAIGVDNDPSLFYRPLRSTASIYLNSLLYRELLAYGSLLEDSGDLQGSLTWRGKAQDLADSINKHCWDERDGTYYSVDLNFLPINPEDWLHKNAPIAWSSLLLRVDNWSSFLPLWAGIASQDQAARMVERIRDSRTFNATYGIRTLSKLEKMYDLRSSNNPSNWLGPIWGVSNYMVFRGLQKYGYTEDARELVEKTVRLFGQDLESSGALHEYYNPDNGEAIMTKGFQNWNFLVLNMIAWLEDRPMFNEF